MYCKVYNRESSPPIIATSTPTKILCNAKVGIFDIVLCATVLFTQLEIVQFLKSAI